MAAACEGMKKEDVVAICGATGAIGAALARRYAKRAARLFLAGRKKEVLRELQREIQNPSCRVETDAFDVRDHNALARWCTKVVDAGVTVVILASGVSASVRAEMAAADGNASQEGVRYLPEDSQDLLRELEVNGMANILAANTIATKVLKARSEGFASHVQIALVASLAAMTGLPGSPGYSASKAALRTYGEALRRLVEKDDMGVTVLLPGFIESEMSRRYQGAKPFLMTADRAALVMERAIESRLAEKAFPAVLAWGIRLLGLVPRRWQSVFLKGFFFTVEPDAESAFSSGAQREQKDKKRVSGD